MSFAVFLGICNKRAESCTMHVGIKLVMFADVNYPAIELLLQQREKYQETRSRTHEHQRFQNLLLADHTHGLLNVRWQVGILQQQIFLLTQRLRWNPHRALVQGCGGWRGKGGRKSMLVPGSWQYNHKAFKNFKNIQKPLKHFKSL